MQKNVNIIINDLSSSVELDGILQYLKKNYELSANFHKHTELFEESEDETLFFLYLSDDEIKIFFNNHLGKKIKMAIIPNDGCKNSMRIYGITKDLFQAIDDGMNEALLSKVDLLQCNELLVFNRVVIGDMHGMNHFSIEQRSPFSQLRDFFKNLGDIKFQKYTLTTSKEQKIVTAASGITILEQSMANSNSTVAEDLSLHDGRLNAFVLAPSSLLSYLWYLISIFFYQRISLVSLPKSLGFIKTAKLTIDSSGKPIEYSVDNKLLSAKELVLTTFADSIWLHLGRVFEEKIKNDKNITDEKDSVRVSSLPAAELSTMLLDGELPLFRKADDEQFKDLFTGLRSSAKFSAVFLTLMVLSTLLATTGLFADSSPVIIGAMILAPLMSPIVSLSMGVIRADSMLLTQSLKTLFIGIVMALIFSSIFTFFMPLQEITPQMQARLNPNLLDLLVAIFSGFAGAYATSKEEIAKSLAGVSIAVALVPPLSVTGIGIGLGNFDMIYGSFLLFTTNLVGITLSGALTFIILGYAPVKRAKKGILYTSVLMVLITIPLFASFMHIVEVNRYTAILKPLKTVVIANKELTLKILSLDTQEEKIVLQLEVISNGSLTHLELEKLKIILEEKLHKQILLDVSTRDSL